jgi:hypothetical protein
MEERGPQESSGDDQVGHVLHPHGAATGTVDAPGQLPAAMRAAPGRTDRRKSQATKCCEISSLSRDRIDRRYTRSRGAGYRYSEPGSSPATRASRVSRNECRGEEDEMRDY